MVSEEFKKEFSETFNRLWLVFFAHHAPDKFHRCLRIQIRGRKLYLCARCTGMLSGIYVAVFLLPLLQSLVLPTIAWIVLIAFPLPAIVDWLSQYSGKRESNNRIRVVSGLLLGSSIGSIAHFREYVLTLSVVSIYVLLIAAVVLVIRTKRGGDTRGSR
ncbi:MAG: DUF2085 domain-containing protein [Candidatus Hodarchaeota archaeon]